jgi:hypothetical protein
MLRRIPRAKSLLTTKNSVPYANRIGRPEAIGAERGQGVLAPKLHLSEC